MIQTRKRLAGPVILAALLVITMLVLPPASLQNGAYQVFRLGAWGKVALERQGMKVVNAHRATVYYSDGDSNSAALVGQLFDQYSPQVDSDYGLTMTQPIQVVIYGTRSSLANSMGWSSGDSALGVYWGGSIKLLSPATWLGNDRSQQLIAETYSKTGPIAHEYTHYAIDQLTAGNIPRWLNEGLAQVEEQKITGYQWIEAGSWLTTSNLYPLSSMDQGFDQLPNQALAYHQSYTLARFLVEKEGQAKVNLMLSKLGEGYTLDQAMRQVMGYGLVEYQAAWQAWLVADYGVGPN